MAFHGFPPAVLANYHTDAYRDLSKSFNTTRLRVRGRNAALRLASSPTAPRQDGQSRSAGSVAWVGDAVHLSPLQSDAQSTDPITSGSP